MEKEREVYVIKATKGKDSNILKVAAYCRVSTDSEDQINSFVEQIRYYNDFIRSRGDMVLVDIYADEGITGTSVNKRDEFNRMMKDSKAGKIDKKKDGAHYYWRCISRLENGDKYCSNSKGLEEELLKKTICEALSSVLAKRENGYEVLKSRMIYAAAGDEHSNELYVIEMAISDAMGRIDELTELAVKFKSNRDKYDAAIGECNEQLRVLREKKENILEQLNHNEKARKEMERIEKHLTEDMVVIPEFNDGFIRRMVTSIRVTQDNNLQICIKGGYEIMASFPCDKNAA